MVPPTSRTTRRIGGEGRRAPNVRVCKAAAANGLSDCLLVKYVNDSTTGTVLLSMRFCRTSTTATSMAMTEKLDLYTEKASAGACVAIVGLTSQRDLANANKESLWSLPLKLRPRFTVWRCL